jgi:hypothetical protein
LHPLTVLVCNLCLFLLRFAVEVSLRRGMKIDSGLG